MKKLLIASILAFALTGCAVQQSNYVQPTEQGLTAPSMDSVISASVEVLKQKYPPAKSALKIFVTEDAISSPLITALRQAGYAVHEVLPEPQFKSAYEEETKPTIPDSAQELRYVFDVLDKSQALFQLTMSVEKTRIAGVFKLDHGQYKQVSPWSVF